jgi:predicted metalloprotease with PDZ domain
MRPTIRCAIAIAIAVCATAAEAAAPVQYRVTIPEPQHRWMQVEASFPDVGNGALELRMSRSSPGRYSLHEFAKNVYDVHTFGADGRELTPTRPDPYGWTVAGHGGTVTVKYKVYGDRVDGTYLAIDETHAHINMPAAFMWAHGLEDRSVTITLDPPPNRSWQVATQLHPSGALQFTAPNLQYFMDSPVEFGQIAMREFTVNGSRFRVALHHQGSDAELDSYAKDVETIVREEGAIYGEFPSYEPGHYTFLADYLPWADGDGMEHRNSTVMTGRPARASDALGTAAHEFFHCWNVERIRPKGLEPFDFDRANLSGELWLAEGFTQYYGPLVLQRAGLVELPSTAGTLTGLIESVAQNAGRMVRTAEQMSQMAPFIDGGRAIDRTNWSTTVISYYPFGGAIALALDLSLRDRTDSRLSLDDYMRAMWRKYGKPGGAAEGIVDHPYTIADAEATLGELTADRAFARDFFAKYIQGHDLADYTRLLARAGFVVRKRNAGHAWLGDLRLDLRNNVAHVATLVSPAWPIYNAGLDQDDELREIDGQRITSDGELASVLGRHKPGDSVAVVFVDRTGSAKTVNVALAEDPHLEVVPAEKTGATLTAAQQQFRDRWLKSRS